MLAGGDGGEVRALGIFGSGGWGFARNFFRRQRVKRRTKYTARDASIPRALEHFYRTRDYSATAGALLLAPRALNWRFYLAASVGDALMYG